ncbi:MAG TPA: hypothetical protein VHE60_13200 [Pyrinomonadaceae bacterium]|nr:hypothetical protein [Pyrinomonadaceae bacterium]
MLDRFLCIRVAAFSLIGYCTAIAGPMLLDPKLPTHIGYGPRSYPPHGWIWWLFTPLAFLLPYISLRIFTSNEALLVSSIAPLLILAAAASFSFPPERPHMGVLLCGLGFAVIILITVAIRIKASDFAYIADTTVPFESRLEHVKATAAFWQMISVYAGAAYLAFGVSWIYAMWFTTEKMVSSAEDKFTLGQAQVALAVAVTICVVVGPLLEAFLNAFGAIAQLSNVKK